MATSPNITQITAPRVDLLDPQTGLVSREWYRFFYNLYVITGDGSGITAVINGGTGLSTIPTNGQLLIGNGTGYTLNTLAVGNGISVVNGIGTITVANTGVLSNIAGAGISVSGATGNVTIANTGVLSFSGGTTGLTPATAATGAVTLAGTLGIANGGTNGSATPTAYGVAYGTGTAYAFTAAGTTKQALLANTGAAPTWSTLTTGGSILYGDGLGGFSNVTIGTGISFAGGTLSATGSGGTVTSVSGTGTVNGITLTGTVTSSGSLTLGGTLSGIGNSQLTNSTISGVSLGGNLFDLTAGTGVSFSSGTTYNGSAAITITATGSGGTVTSVTGTSPVNVATGTTTPVISLASGYGDTQNPYASKTANFVLAAPNGLAGVPTFRALVAADVPGSALTKTDDTNVTLTLGGSPTTALLNAASLTLGWTGQLSVARGGTGISTTPSNGQLLIGNGTNYTAATLTAGYGISVTDGAGSITVATNLAVPQITNYTSGSGTYTVPANTKYLQVLMVGGGGGGAGSGSGGGSGGSGGSTTFGTATSAGGSGGATNGSVGGAGGAATVGSISGVAISGATGDGGTTTNVVSTYPKGGAGAASALGGAGAGSGGSSAGAGGSGRTNTGGGGGGAGGSATATFGGSGGGAGAYIDGLITSPAASYSYAVGASGTAGTAGASGNAGGAGGSGYIMVVAYF